ncbi:hypothetical protein DOTSEDRAFT_67897, partial [Dothistroma septosporum NZE10]
MYTTTNLSNGIALDSESLQPGCRQAATRSSTPLVLSSGEAKMQLICCIWKFGVSRTSWSRSLAVMMLPLQLNIALHRKRSRVRAAPGPVMSESEHPVHLLLLCRTTLKSSNLAQHYVRYGGLGML